MNFAKLDLDPRGVATLALDRPEVRNAFNAELISEITESVRGIDVDARVLVLRGEGKAFSAGADLEWMRSMANFTMEENIADSNSLRLMFDAIDNAGVPVVGRIHGAAIAGATGLVACCDYAIASEETIFGFTEVTLGLVPAVISPYVIRKVGYSFARAMFLTAERFDARRALEAGLIHRVVALDQLDAAVEAVVDEVLAGGPTALRRARQLLEEISGKSPHDVADMTVRTIAEVRVSSEGQEGVTSVLEKRPPSWKPGR